MCLIRDGIYVFGLIMIYLYIILEGVFNYDIIIYNRKVCVWFLNYYI